MESQPKSVFIPTFISPFLFFIVEKKDLIVRILIDRVISSAGPKIIRNAIENSNDMVMVRVDGIWARAKIESAVEEEGLQKPYYICWLFDYGVMRTVYSVYETPEDVKYIPALAKPASFNNLVNLTTEITIGKNGYETKFVKSLSQIEGVKNVTCNLIKEAEDVLFDFQRQDGDTYCGDIICEQKNGALHSVANHLKKEKVMDEDSVMFARVKNIRSFLKKKYYKYSSSLNEPISNTSQIDRAEIIFNDEVNSYQVMEYFNRQRDVPY